MDTSYIVKKLEAAFPGAKIDVATDGRHYEAIIVYKDFAGKSLVQQHKMVYAVLAHELATDQIHALKLTTKEK